MRWLQILILVLFFLELLAAAYMHGKPWKAPAAHHNFFARSFGVAIRMAMLWGAGTFSTIVGH